MESIRVDFDTDREGPAAIRLLQMVLFFTLLKKRILGWENIYTLVAAKSYGKIKVNMSAENPLSRLRVIDDN